MDFLFSGGDREAAIDMDYELACESIFSATLYFLEKRVSALAPTFRHINPYIGSIYVPDGHAKPLLFGPASGPQLATNYQD